MAISCMVIILLLCPTSIRIFIEAAEWLTMRQIRAIWKKNSDMRLLNHSRQGDETMAPSIWTWSRAAVFLALSAYLLFAHGCHGDEDHELFAPVAFIPGVNGEMP